jgi:hypothetical protein
VSGKRYSPARAPFLTWIPPLHRRMADARSFTISSLRRTIQPHGFRVVGWSRLMPPFDRSRFGKRIRATTDRLERTPLGVFGLTVIIVFERMPVSSRSRSSRP